MKGSGWRAPLTLCRRLARMLVVCLALLVPGAGLCLGTPTYQGREASSRWRAEAAARIERIRKSEISLEVVDGAGQPLAGAEVQVTMQRHLFPFGSAVTAHDLTAETGDGERYRQVVESHFNKVTLENDLKWEQWDRSKDGSGYAFYQKANTDKAFSWLSRRRIPVRGHYAVWAHLEGDEGTVKRKWMSPEKFAAAIRKHVEEEVGEVGTRVTEWDVVNHPLGWGRGTMQDRFGPSFYDAVFEQVAKLNPQAKRYLNEGGVLPHRGYNRDKYYALISQMRERGAKVQGIGFMGHFKADTDLASPEELLATFDRFAKLGLPLQITEFDVRFGSEINKPLPLTAEQEQLQADYLRDFFTAAFSHPGVHGIIMWGFWEGRHWYPDAALYRKDWSLKPNGKAWQDLVLKEWWTKAAGKTDLEGHFRARGFLGDYQVKVKYQGRVLVKHFTLLEGGTTLRLSL